MPPLTLWSVPSRGEVRVTTYPHTQCNQMHDLRYLQQNFAIFLKDGFSPSIFKSTNIPLNHLSSETLHLQGAQKL